MKQSGVPTLLATVVLGAFVAIGAARAEPTSQAAGFLRRTIVGAASGSKPTETVLSFPLHEAAVFSGNADTVDGADALTIALANWTEGQYTATPYVAHFVTGNDTGHWFLITANTASQLTLDNRGISLVGQVNTGDGVEIYPAHTLGSLFGTSSVALQSGRSVAKADNVSIWDGSKFIRYYFNGLNWTDDANVNCNNVVIPPDSGVIVTRRSVQPVTLVFNGMVPDTTEHSDVVGPGSFLLANRFPLPTTLSALGLSELLNWRSRDKAKKADEVLLWKSGEWAAYYFDGKNWRASEQPEKAANAKVIAAGSAVFVVRKSEAKGQAATLAQDPSYMGN